MRAKKSLGQHFLTSNRALGKIIEAGDLSENDVVLEIGPGKGALTEKLLATGCKLLAVEKDDELHEFIKEKFSSEIEAGRLKLIHDDILDFDLKSYELLARSYKLVSNIPYNITGQILRKFLSADCKPERMVLLVQKEVAQRIVARQKALGSARGKESVLSISVKAYGKPRYVETVKAGSFAPAPKVDSAIIAIDDISDHFFKDFTEEDFFQLIRTGFKSKRKQLGSNLKTMFPKEKMGAMFKELKLSPKVRAEDVNKEIWRNILIYLKQ